MHLTVKILNGEECTLAASPSSLVRDVKEQLEALFSIPVADQKLLFKGKALMDVKPLKDYGVQDNSKITLVIKKYSTKLSGDSSSVLPQKSCCLETERPAWEMMRRFLRRHFREQDVECVLQEFKKEFERNLTNLSLDDIERFATTKLHV